jgi:hypothetical protein
MDRPLDVIAYLLAKTVSIAENKPIEAVIAEALEATRREPMQRQDDEDNKAVEEIYAAYPGKCPISGRSTGKCSKNKKQIATLLKTRDEQDIKRTIDRYLEDCKSSKTYIKNFGTLLNQFPESKPETPAPPQKPSTGHQEIWEDPLYKQWREQQKQIQ